ncbi:hypothetical protein C8R45DRAFT_129589 [Mycena sanguinolenta]|nr:hypothetical protein C8R45DRAFT_129589 [Mycena sanguinolenta]
MSPTPSLRRKDKTLRRSDASFKRSPEPNAARCRTLRRSPVPQPNVSPSFSYVSDSEPSYALSDASFSPSPKAEFRQNISQMPVELWAMVADFASRSSVACLCGVSRHFHTLFLPTLYRNTIHPPLTAAQTALFLQTLASKKPASGQPHPALLVRELGLVDTVGSEIILDSSTISKALKRLHLAEGLRTLEWTLAAGVDDLGKIFGAPGRFPHLRELVVSCKGKNNNFNFAQIPGLEVLELHINLAELMDMYDIGAKAIYKLSQALGMLASSSPHLHTLGLNLKIPFFNDEFPDNAYTDLIATVNSIYLPLLGNVDFSFDFSPDICYYDGFGPPELPKTDLSLFLSNHPNLTHLALHTHSTNLTEVDALMPRLRCFCGSFRDASVLCAGSRQLRSLVLALLYFDFLDFMPSFELVPLPPHGSLTHIRVCVAEADGKIIKMPEELSPRSLQQIVTAFPSLTHLDVVISRRMVRT